MSESPLHRDLVSLLVSAIARDHAEVSQAAGASLLPDPPAIGRHEPDALARGLSQTLIIGEAKTGPDLFEEVSQEHFYDFTHHLDEQTGELAAFVLIVPAGWREEAERALAAADADPDRYSIVTAAVPNALPPQSA